jgi:DNA-binding LacI/PurR family transcriptional regulator
MAGVPFVYEEIKRGLLSRIGRQWPVGARLPSATDLARQLGAGHRNTLRAMQELVREGYLHSRPGRGTFVAENLPSQSGRLPQAASAVRALRLLVLMGIQHHDRFMLDTAHAIESTLAAHDVRTEFRFINSNYDLTEAPYCDFDAFAILNPDCRRIRMKDKQKAVIASTVPSVRVLGTGGFDLVTIEEEHGAALAGQLLREAGHASACFLGVGHTGSPTAMNNLISAVRLRGFESGFGRPVSAEHQLYATSFQDESGAVLLPRYLALPNRPRAVFAASDELAIGFAIGSAAMGVTPGKDFDLVGFDGQHRGRTLNVCPPLTSVAIPSQEMGRRAAELLLDRIHRPDKPVERVLLECSIFRGGTVAPRPSSITSSEVPS